MSGDTIITVVGNLTADVELRTTPSGAPVANFTVASTPRQFDRQSGEWTDGEALFLRCNIWRQAASNAAKTLSRGSRVIVTGRLRQRSFETRDGEKRTTVELEVEEVGPSLRYATARVSKLNGAVAGEPPSATHVEDATSDDVPSNVVPISAGAVVGDE
jgi:single-strand DNA-binding protein